MLDSETFAVNCEQLRLTDTRFGSPNIHCVNHSCGASRHRRPYPISIFSIADSVAAIGRIGSPERTTHKLPPHFR